MGSSEVSRVMEMAEEKKAPVARVTRCGAMGTSGNVRVLTMDPEASNMFTVMDIFSGLEVTKQLTANGRFWKVVLPNSLNLNTTLY